MKSVLCNKKKYDKLKYLTPIHKCLEGIVIWLGTRKLLILFFCNFTSIPSLYKISFLVNDNNDVILMVKVLIILIKDWWLLWDPLFQQERDRW